jgi:HlyD family secretion protein
MDDDPRHLIGRLNLVGFGLILLVFGGFGGWAATAQLSGAVISQGVIVVESRVKKVQHSTGGIVGELLVHEGDPVEAGQVVMRLDDTMTRATLGMVRSQLDALLAREARLLAEQEGAEQIAFPADLLARLDEAIVGTAIRGEQKLMEARADGRRSLKSQLRERIVQTGAEIQGLVAQQVSKEDEIKLINEELVGVTELWDKQLISISRMMLLQRDKVRLEGLRGQNISDIARARARISETELQATQGDQDFLNDILKDLRDAQGKIADLQERLTAAQDQLRRIEIRAPQAGVIYQLSVYTVGGVIAPGETVMQIVPRADELVVEAKVSPQDIDQIAIGTAAVLHLHAGNQRTMPDLGARVTMISADLTREQGPGGQTGPSYFLVRMALEADVASKLGDLHIIPGMMVDAFIQTYARTPLQYLLKPLQEHMSRTFRER